MIEMESSPLLRKHASPWTYARRAVGAVLLCSAWAALVRGRRGSAAPTDAELAAATAPLSMTMEKEAPMLVISIENDYTVALGPIGAAYPWAAGATVIDANREFEAFAEGGSAWALDGAAVGAGERVRLTLAPGDYALGVAGSGRSGSAKLVARRVRREIRELSKGDRDRWLDALAVIMASTAETKAEGAATFTASDFLQVHLANAARRDNDHFHAGNGFFAQHARIDLLMTEALVATDPLVVSPYWDWTIEQAAVDAGAVASVWDTVLWTADVFGSPNFLETPILVDELFTPMTASFDEFTRRGNDAWKIRDSRFRAAAMTGVAEADDGTVLHNAYGLVRSPWNENPSPYVTRVQHSRAIFPSCAATFDTLFGEAAPATLTGFMVALEDAPHADVHKSIGGLVVDEGSIEAVRAAARVATGLDADIIYFIMLPKHAWRRNLADLKATPNQCASSAGTAACASLACDETTDLAALGRLAIEKAVDGADEDADWYDQGKLAALGEAVCDIALFKGDNYEATGTGDPAFFAIHPTLVRLVQLRELSADRPPLVDDWATLDDTEDACVFMAGACVDVTGADADLARCCAGHHSYSTYYASDGSFAPVATNADVVQTVSASNADPETAIVFHHFSYAHCDTDFGVY